MIVLQMSLSTEFRATAWNSSELLTPLPASLLG
jgi:hypothetical protein